jgi:hypothetical protein
MDVDANLSKFMGARTPEARYTSFDYCFNYFQSYRERNETAQLAAPENMQLSCLQLGFFLASWGMFRGPAQLLVKSVKHYEPVVDVIASAQPIVWEIDADRYSEAWGALQNLDRQIRSAFHHPNGVSDTLVTKVMLGVFGNVPAFDDNFKIGFKASTFGPKALRGMGRFYHDNAEVIERHRVHTLDFDTGEPTHRTYTRAKVIDMIFFIEGGGRGSRF